MEYDVAEVRRQLQLSVLKPIVAKLLIELRTKMAGLDDCESEVQDAGDEEASQSDDESDEDYETE
jgi:hypothetical protein